MRISRITIENINIYDNPNINTIQADADGFSLIVTAMWNSIQAMRDTNMKLLRVEWESDAEL
jgi:hypothetical protein